MTENKSILVGGIALLIGTPFLGVAAWILWTYPWTNILVSVALVYLLRNYDSNFMQSNKEWWIRKRPR